MDRFSDRRLKRAKEISVYNAQMTLPEFSLPPDIAKLNEQYVAGALTFLEKASKLEALYGVTVSDQISREDACIRSQANIELEGFFLEPVAILLNERYIAGELELDAKLRLIQKFYSSP